MTLEEMKAELEKNGYVVLKKGGYEWYKQPLEEVCAYAESVGYGTDTVRRKYGGAHNIVVRMSKHFKEQFGISHLCNVPDTKFYRDYFVEQGIKIVDILVEEREKRRRKFWGES